MIIYKQVDPSFFPQYDKISMKLVVTSIYEIVKMDGGLGGFSIVETPVNAYVKDFCTGEDESVSRWEKNFDLSNWAFFMAFDGDKPVGAATVASRTEGVNMLSGRNDLAVLWDLRVEEAYKGKGIGQKLFDLACDWARDNQLIQMKIECQNNNVPAVKFYHKQGAKLGTIDEYAYYNDPDFRSEIQLIWYLDL